MTPEDQTSLPDDASLDQRIRMVEQRMMRHRASSKARLALFRWQLRDRMTSPLALLLATGIGFAMGPSKGSKPAASSAEAPPRADGVQFLSTIVSWVSLTGSVMSLWQRFRTDGQPAGPTRSAAQPESGTARPGLDGGASAPKADAPPAPCSAPGASGIQQTQKNTPA